jgi:hypothetical protein
MVGLQGCTVNIHSGNHLASATWILKRGGRACALIERLDNLTHAGS